MRGRTAAITVAAVATVLVATAATVGHLLTQNGTQPASCQAGGAPVAGPTITYTASPSYWTSQSMRDVHGHENQQTDTTPNCATAPAATTGTSQRLSGRP